MFIHRSLFGLGLVALTATSAAGWERGNHAGDWTKGATIKVFVDPIPAEAPAGTAAAVADAIKEWNDAQAVFGGLTLMTEGADKTNSEIHILRNPYKVGQPFVSFWGDLPDKRSRRRVYENHG